MSHFYVRVVIAAHAPFDSRTCPTGFPFSTAPWHVIFQFWCARGVLKSGWTVECHHPCRDFSRHCVRKIFTRDHVQGHRPVRNFFWRQN